MLLASSTPEAGSVSSHKLVVFLGEKLSWVWAFFFLKVSCFFFFLPKGLSSPETQGLMQSPWNNRLTSDALLVSVSYVLCLMSLWKDTATVSHQACVTHPPLSGPVISRGSLGVPITGKREWSWDLAAPGVG